MARRAALGMAPAAYNASSVYQPPPAMQHRDQALSTAPRLALRDAPPLALRHGTRNDRFPITAPGTAAAHLAKAGWGGAAARTPFPPWQHPRHLGLSSKGLGGLGGMAAKDAPSSWGDPAATFGPSAAASAHLGGPDQVWRIG